MFQHRDVICFLGDSITANGLWMAEVYQALRKKHSVKCYNCGVSGATAQNALLYLHSQCLIYNPDYVVMMFGINDIRRDLYAEKYSNDQQIPKAKEEALKAHKEAYEKLVQQTIASGAKVILCLAAPYDDVNDKEEYNLKCQTAMDESGAFLQSLAKKYDCHLVDFKTVMQSMLAERNIISADRVHPTPEGHHVMAQIFLHDVGEQDGYDFDTPFVWEQWNRERYDAEQELILVNFIEYCMLLKEGYVENKSYEERKKIAAQRYENYEDKASVLPTAYREYIKKIDGYNRYMGQIVKRTVF